MRRLSRREQRQKRIVFWGAIIALAGLMATVASAGFLASDTVREDEDQAATTTTTVPLNDAARELLALLEKDRAATFHARYAAQSKAQPDAQVEVETWRKPPKVRQDTIVTKGGSKVHTSAYVLDGTGVQCARLGEAAWSCQTKQAGPTDDLLFSGVHEQLGKGPVTVKDDVIDGRRVRCFTLTIPAENQSSELCATEAGIPVRVVSTQASLRLIGFDEAVTDEVFVPPASPSPAQ